MEPVFKIVLASGVLGAWCLRTGCLLQRSENRFRDGRLVIEEMEKCQFSIDVENADSEYLIKIGDIPLHDILERRHADGVVIDGIRKWPDEAFFESARGVTSIQIYTGRAHSNEWVYCNSFEVSVSPSKVGEFAYSLMVEQLGQISRGLLLDLFGKSKTTHGIRLARSAQLMRSKEEELAHVGRLTAELKLLTNRIEQRPASRIVSVISPIRYRGDKRVGRRALVQLIAKGQGLGAGAQPIHLTDSVPRESFDIPEHRSLKAFVLLLRRRCMQCAEAAKRHISAIEDDRIWRDMSIAGRSSLYEKIDRPIIERLEDAIQWAGDTCSSLELLAQHPLLKNCSPEFKEFGGGIFERNSDYRRIGWIIRSFFNSHASWFDGDAYGGVTKLTSRIYEQWCFLKVVEAFRKTGLELIDWSGTLNGRSQRRFTVDFDRDLRFEGEISPNWRVRIRYEPWIKGKEQASKMVGETLFRGKGDTAWSPDIVIEFLRLRDDAWMSVYVMVMDCKYSRNIQEHHWNGTRKYKQIREVNSGSQVVRQLWLIAPIGGSVIQSPDEEVDFTADGPSCSPSETVEFILSARPDNENTTAGFEMIAAGMLNYVGQIEDVYD